MWARKRFDITWRDLWFAGGRCLARGDRAAAEARIGSVCSDAGDVLACQSVRSGFDLLLGAAGYPEGSEVLVSAITIPDMVRIIRQHGLIPVPLDLDPDTALPPPAQIADRITPRTKAVLIAHLFGSTPPLDAHIAIAREHGLLFIEDCAQAFRGREYSGHPRADVSLFSFGTIKTATALGGAVVHVRDGGLLAGMRQRQAAWRIQPRAEYLCRIAKYVLLKALSYRLSLQCLIQALRLLGRDYDQMLNSSVSGFAADQLFDLIRRQPSVPLLDVLGRRLETFDRERQRARSGRGRRFAEALRGSFVCPAAYVSPHMYWVFPILADAPDAVRMELFRHGFDSTQGQSMIVVEPPAGRDNLEPHEARRLLARILYLPFYDALPDAELDRMAAVLVRCTGSRTGSAFDATQAARPTPMASS